MKELFKMLCRISLIIFALVLLTGCKDKAAEKDSGQEVPEESNMMYEDEAPASEIELFNLHGISFYRGAALMIVSGNGKTYDITASDGCLGSFSEHYKASTISVSTDDEDMADAGSRDVFLFGPGEDEEKKPFGPIDSDRVLIRIIVREGERISGYALIAFWEKEGPAERPIFSSGKILKEVSFRKKDGTYPQVTLQEVNARLDQAEKIYVTEELFKSHNIIGAE